MKIPGRHPSAEDRANLAACAVTAIDVENDDTTSAIWVLPLMEGAPCCPSGLAEALFVELKRGASPHSEWVIYPGGTHKFTEMSPPSHRLDAMQRIVGWMTRWIQ